MAYCSSLKTISYSCWYVNLCGDFPARENHIRWNKLCAQDEESTSIPPITPGYFFVKDLAAALATDQLITAPQLLIPLIKFWTIKWSFSKSKGRPVFKEYFLIELRCWRFCFFTCYSCFSYFFLNSLTVLFFMSEKSFLKWRTAFPCLEAYFLTVYRFSSVHFVYFEAFWTVASCSASKSTAPSSVLLETSPRNRMKKTENVLACRIFLKDFARIFQNVNKFIKPTMTSWIQNNGKV